MAHKDLELRIKTILPEEYQDSYEDVQPVSMGSAGLKYGDDGTVSWDDMWETFCDLAMAGGPPHKGMLLQQGSQAEIAMQPDRYQEVAAEICRGIAMVTDLEARPSDPGWIRVECDSPCSAEWLVRAIVMENVSCHCDGAAIHLPAGPAYRIEKEIKNVVTAVAKTCHYWFDHMWQSQRRRIADLLAVMARESPLIQPAVSGDGIQPASHRLLSAKIAAAIQQMTGLQASNHQYPGWLGLECPDVRAAIWMMRALVVSNVLSRREDTVLFVPVNPTIDPSGATVEQSLIQVHGFARTRGLV